MSLSDELGSSSSSVKKADSPKQTVNLQRAYKDIGGLSS